MTTTQHLKFGRTIFILTIWCMMFPWIVASDKISKCSLTYLFKFKLYNQIWNKCSKHGLDKLQRFIWTHCSDSNFSSLTFLQFISVSSSVKLWKQLNLIIIIFIFIISLWSSRFSESVEAPPLLWSAQLLWLVSCSFSFWLFILYFLLCESNVYYMNIQ